MSAAKRSVGFNELLVLLLVLALTVGVSASFTAWSSYQNSKPSNFEECVAAGKPIMESYPEQCSANGHTYTNLTQASKNWLLFKGSLINYKKQRSDYQIRIPDGWKMNQTSNAEVKDLFTYDSDLSVKEGRKASLITDDTLYDKDNHPALDIQFGSSSEGSNTGDLQKSLKTLTGMEIMKYTRQVGKSGPNAYSEPAGMYYEYFVESHGVVLRCNYYVPIGQPDFHEDVESSLRTFVAS